MEKDEKIFRLAAILYADQNYDVTSKTIIKKIIESVYLELDKNSLSVNTIVDFCKSNYYLDFDIVEILRIVESPKNDSFFLYYSKDGDPIVQLDESRRILLKKKLNQNSIDISIKQFAANNKIEYTEFHKLIYRFLYYTLNHNQTEFLKLINYSDSLPYPFPSDSKVFTIDERKLINDYLNWDDDEKNKAVFDIITYSIEYCLLVSNNKDSFELRYLKNKSFYLDTNIIYRVLGINGDTRKKRTETFFQRCQETKINVFISKYSDKEFKDSVKYYITKMKAFGGRRANSELFSQYSENFDIYDFYYRWRENRTSTNFNLFQNHILSLYEDFKTKYHIKIDHKISFDERSEPIKQVISKYSAQINNFKKSVEESDPNEASNCDAYNIYLLEQRRESHFLNLYDTKFFFLSTDQMLRKWDFKRSDFVPIVIHPSQWLSIMLRFVSRSVDDYKSYISFLNLRQADKIIDNEKLYIVFSAISELTEDFKTQQELIKTIIQSHFDKVLNPIFSNEDVYENTSQYVKSMLEKRIDNVENDNLTLSKELQNVREEVGTLKSTDEDKSSILEVLTDENISLKNELLDKYRYKKLLIWKSSGYLVFFLLVFTIIYFILQLFRIDWEYNYPLQILHYIDSTKSESIKSILLSLNWAYVASSSGMGYFVYRRLYSKKHKDEFIKSIEIPNRYK